MKPLCVCCISMLLMATMPLVADVATVNGVTWTYTVTNGKATVGSGSSSSPAVSTSTTGAITIPSKLGGKPVTSIGGYAFSGCSGLTSVTIPDSVTGIGGYAFSGCIGLTSVTIGDGVTSIGSSAFSGCSGLTSVTIPDRVTSIGNWAFEDCSGLTSVTIPNSVTSIGEGAFYNCSGLTSVTIPDSVMSIGTCAFQYCSGLAHVAIGGGVTSIGHLAFSGCNNSLYDTTTIPNVELVDGWAVGNTGVSGDLDLTGMRGIGDEAFRGCSGLTSVTIPDSVTSIGGHAFNGCSALTSVTIPDGVTYIGSSAFSGCSGLTSVTIGNGVTSIGGCAFYGCSGLTSVTIGNGVTRIGDEAFRGCSGLTSVTIPDRVTSIGESAFRGCSGLTSLTIPDSVTRIAIYAFQGCSGLTNVMIPKGVTSIERSAFYGCRSLNIVYVPIYLYSTLCFNGSNSLPGTSAIIVSYTPTFTVTFDANGGTGSTSAVMDYGTVIVAPTVSRIGYTFTSWDKAVAAKVPAHDVTYTAQWGISQYAVTFDANGGEGGTSGEQAYNSPIVAPSVSRVGYTFAGWVPEVDSVVPANDVTYVAQWTINKHTVTFDANGGTGGTSAVMDYGSAIVVPTVLRADYTFKGWDKEVAATVPDYDVTYTAQWEINQYTVTFDANGGEGGTSGEQDYNSPIVAPSVSRVGYTFSGWSPEVDVVVPANNVTYVAQWTINKHTVTFDANGGTGGWSEVRDYGTAIVAPTVTRTGYTFKGWDKGIAATVPDEDVTYTAQWEINQYTVTFDANGGDGGTCSEQDYNSPIVAPSVSRVGYTFAGWLPEVDAVVPANDVTYVAQWTINKHTVTFDANGGTGGTSGVFDYGTEIVLPTVSRTGYTFRGWDKEVAATVPDEDVTYTAEWEAKAYTVSFDPNDGDMNGGVASKEVVFDSTYGELPMPVMEFYSFDGWMLNGAVVTPSTKVATAADHTLVAQWNRWGARIAASAVLSGQKLRELYPDDYANLTTVVFEEGILELPVGFFDGCDNVESLTLPESLETLGYDDMPTKIRASLDYGEDGFMVYQGWVLGYSNNGASALTLPQDVIGIGTRAFAEFWDLETVTIPDTVKHIGREAFFECTFLDDVEIPGSVETIGYGAFENCSYMQTLSVGNGVRKVADRAFARCTSLQAVAFGDGLENVGECAFSNDWRMLSVSLPHSVTNIGIGAFAACRRVKGVAVPSNIMTLADMFPAAYANIESVVVASGETDIMDDMFNGCAVLVDFAWAGCETNVGERAFLGCANLTSVAMPDSVVRIGSEAFKDCSLLHDLTLSRSLESLPDFAFDGCGALDSFIVPASVMSLGEGFVYGSAVSAIYYLGNAPEYDADAYANVVENLVTYVVKGTRGWDGTPSSRVLPEDWMGHEITYWTPNRFDVTFDANGGYFGASSVMQWAEQQITDMGYVLPNQSPVRPGYAFEGWWTEATAGAQVKYSTQVTATKAHVLYAHWRLLGNLVTATFNANGGTVVVPGSQSYVAGQTFGEFPVPSRRGYSFCGWWTEAAGGERITEATSVPAADIELFAHWEPIRYFVGYDANGGTGSMTNQVHVYDTPKALDGNMFSRTGYAFTGWARSAEGQVEYADRAEVVNLAEVSNEVVRLYAVWSGAGYNVRFDSNGGTGVMEDQTIQISETQNLHTNAFVFSGREFLGWATASGGTVEYRDGEAVSGLSSVNGATVHLYAVWRVSDEVWRVSFDGNGGSVAPAYWNVARGGSLDALPTPTRPGYAFMGWWTQMVGGIFVSPSFAVESNMTLYAHWRAYDDPLPPVVGDMGVVSVMGDSADLRLGENVKTVEEYNALVEWADENGIDHQTVRTSLHVWQSFALCADKLIEGEITKEDVTIDSFEPSAEKPGEFMFEVSIKDVNISSTADKARLATVLGIEGSASLDDSSFSSGNVDFDIGTPKDGKATFTAKPKEEAKGDGGAFFMRVRVNQ